MRAPAPAGEAAALRRLEGLVGLLDDRFSIGGFRFGLDGLLGLAPGVGDAATGLFAAYVVYEAWRLGASRSTLARMAANVAVDAAVGSIPLLGDLFDLAWKANRRNLELLRRDLAQRR